MVCCSYAKSTDVDSFDCFLSSGSVNFFDTACRHANYFGALDYGRFAKMDTKIKRENCSVVMYCDSSNRQYRNNDHYCIAGVILTDTQKALLDSKINQLKRNTFDWLKNPESVELKGEWIAGKKRAFRKLRPERMGLFLTELSHTIFDELRPKILPCYLPRLKSLPDTFPKLIKNQKPENRELSPYFSFLLQYNNFLTENGMTGKVIFDEGDDNFKKFLKEQKEREPTRVFDHATRINMSADEILNCVKESAEDNALQIADLFAFTICAFYAFTHAEVISKNGLGKYSKIPKESFDELLKRIKSECEGKRYFPLPVERLKESYVKEPELCSWVLTPRQKV
jgi:hypothetical protein